MKDNYYKVVIMSGKMYVYDPVSDSFKRPYEDFKEKTFKEETEKSNKWDQKEKTKKLFKDPNITLNRLPVFGILKDGPATGYEIERRYPAMVDKIMKDFNLGYKNAKKLIRGDMPDHDTVKNYMKTRFVKFDGSFLQNWKKAGWITHNLETDTYALTESGKQRYIFRMGENQGELKSSQSFIRYKRFISLRIAYLSIGMLDF